ncbi:MAG: hypothetical protein IPQ07_20425 [Myxococcales bacterium]|nr:hypothetical protein [Myxococcales bacterium]
MTVDPTSATTAETRSSPALVRLCQLALRLPVASGASVGPVSAERVRQRAPNTVTKPETLDFRTMLPERGGLFDPRVFGAGTVIDAPPLEPDAPVKPRKTACARVSLAIPLVHPLVREHARAEAAALIGLDTLALGGRRSQLEHERALVRALAASKLGADLVLRELPVLPPELRPLQRDDEDRWATTPLNRWYQRIITRNARIERLIESHAEDAQLEPEYGELASLVHRLYENDEMLDGERDMDGRLLPSLRSLCGGTAELHRAALDLARHPAETPLSGRLHIAEVVMFTLGFEVRGTVEG